MNGARAGEGSGGRLSLNMFGGFRVRHDDQDVIVPIRKGQALLAYLARRPGQTHPRDTLAALLWGDMPQGLARHSLRQALCVLRGVLPPGVTVIRSSAEHVSLDLSRVTVDVLDFERLAAEGTLDALEQAAALYRGELLDGIAVDEPAFEQWLREEREPLHELAVSVLARLLVLQRQAGLTESAIQSGLRLLRLDPLQEVVHRTLMRLYAGLGRPGAAQRQFQLCAEMLRRELGAEPEAETIRLLAEIAPRGRRGPGRPVTHQ